MFMSIMVIPMAMSTDGRLNATNSEPVMNVSTSCTGLFVDIDDSLYCSLANGHRVFKVQSNSDTIMPITVAGTGCPGPVSNMLDHPHGIFVDINFTLYVADTDNNRIQLFYLGQLSGVTVAGNGIPDGFIFNRPTSIVLDIDGYLYVVDSHNHRIMRSVPDGFRCLVGCSGESGATASHLNHPQTMAFDNNGNMLVTDLNNHRIQQFNLAQSSCGTYAYVGLEYNER
jgi:DNA-binding beta-propeller fold protein YncE